MRFLARSRVPIPKAPTQLPAGAKIAVVGESHYQKALGKAAREAEVRPDGERVIEVFLVHEADNRYDENAIAVYSKHGTLGHLARDDAAEFRPVFDTLREHGHDGVTCRAMLHGGTQNKPSLGIVLQLSIPRVCLEHLVHG